MKNKILSIIFLFIAGFAFMAMLMDDCFGYMAYTQKSIATPYVYYILANIIDYGIFFIPFGILGFYFLKKAREK